VDGVELRTFQCIDVPDPCPADCALSAKGPGIVDVTDLLQLLSEWDSIGGDCDVDGSGLVDVVDLLAMLAAWGTCP
jgi:hypothetical protein